MRMMTTLLLHHSPWSGGHAATEDPSMSIVPGTVEYMEMHGSAEHIGWHNGMGSTGNTDTKSSLTNSGSSRFPTKCCSLDSLYGHFMTRGVAMLLFGLVSMVVPMLLSKKQGLEAAAFCHLKARAHSEKCHVSAELEEWGQDEASAVEGSDMPRLERRSDSSFRS
jgi:hypothetical protein